MPGSRPRPPRSAAIHWSKLCLRHFRRRTFFVGGGLWALATLLGGVLVVGVYWFVHHSTLRPQPAKEGEG